MFIGIFHSFRRGRTLITDVQRLPIFRYNDALSRNIIRTTYSGFNLGQRGRENQYRRTVIG